MRATSNSVRKWDVACFDSSMKRFAKPAKSIAKGHSSFLSIDFSIALRGAAGSELATGATAPAEVSL